MLTGNYAATCGQKDWLLGVMPHESYVLGVFEQLWRELGGSIKGGVREGAAPPGARLVATIESPGLGEIVRDINKFSNNVMARQLFLTLGLESGKRPARPADAEAAVRSWLDGHGLAFPGMVIDNGSGLSRQARLSAEDLGRLLQSAWKSPLMPEFVASLPLAAVDGTMKKRFNGDGAAGQMHIKTGTLDGVKAIAGYVLDRNGRNQSVVFIINHDNAQAGQAAEDALLKSGSTTASRRLFRRLAYPSRRPLRRSPAPRPVPAPPPRALAPRLRRRPRRRPIRAVPGGRRRARRSAVQLSTQSPQLM